MAQRTQKKKNSNPTSKKKAGTKSTKKNNKATKKKTSSKSEMKFDKNFISEAIKKPEMLKHLIPGLSSRDIKKVATSSKLFNEITKINPELVLKYAKKIIPLLKHKHTPTRSQIVHTMSLIAHLVPNVIASILPDLGKIINKDKNVKIRDYAIETIARYASTSKKAAKKAYPYLKNSMDQWNKRHAHQAMKGINDVLHYLGELKNDIQKVAGNFIDNSREIVQKEAKRMLKLIGV